MHKLRRSVTACAAVLFVLIWQQGYVGPQLASADDPLPPGSVDCGYGLICGGSQVDVSPGTGPLVVSGPEDRIVQPHHDSLFTSLGYPFDNFVSPDNSWAYLENWAEAYVAARHHVPNDSRITDWARDEVREAMLERLIQIASDPTNDVELPNHAPTSCPTLNRQREVRVECQNQIAYQTLKALAWTARYNSAVNAVNLQEQWASNPCAFQWPAAYKDPNEYLQRPATIEACHNVSVGGLLSTVPSPSAEEFTGAGAAQEFAGLDTPEATQVIDNVKLAAVIEGSLALSGIAIGAAAEAVIFALTGSFVPGTASIVVSSTGVFFYNDTLLALLGGVTAAGGVALAILGAAAIGVSIWQFVEQEEIPTKLHDALVSAQGAIDISSYAADPDKSKFLSAIFFRETLPDYSGTPYRVPGTPPHTSLDPHFTDVGHIESGSLVADPPSDTITPSDWDGQPHTVYMSDGWFSDQTGNETPIYKTKIKFIDWSGEQLIASVEGDKFFVTNTHPPEQADELSQLQYVDADGVERTATLHVDQPPTLSPTATGSFYEGNTIQFDANATDPGGGPVTVQWRIEDPRGQQILLQDSNGKTGLDLCYTDPLEKTRPPDDLFFGCPWPAFTGQTVQFTYRESGQFHVHVIATDADGQTTSEVFQVNIENVDPTLSVNPLSGAAVNEGSPVTVTGSVNDPGDDPVGVTIDWGDGTTDTQYFPCNWTLSAVQGGCQGADVDGNLRVVPAPDPTEFTLGHTYANNPSSGTTWPIEVTAFDDDGGSSQPVDLTQEVDNVAPTLYVHCGDLTPPFLGIDPLHCDDRFGDTSYAVPVRGYFEDPGADSWALDVNWGDGNTDTFTYPCASGDPCPFSTDSLIPGGIYLPAPNRVFFDPTHTYSHPGNYPIGASITDGESTPVTATGSNSAAISAPPDTSDPTITLTAPADGATYTLGQSLNADYTCQDDVAIAACTGTVDAGSAIDTSTVGQHAFTVNATDTSGNPATTTVHYIVDYPFSIVSPFASPPSVNELLAGHKVRIKFSLGGNQPPPVTHGLARHAAINCDTDVRLGKWSTRYLSKIAYRSKPNSYYFVWRPPAYWAGTCQEILIRMTDGTQQTLLFHFVP
jgi:hypothetical protein